MKNNKQKIAIIGSGFTGLVAAYELSKDNYDITLIERGNDLGGLASGFQIEGTNLEKAYHHIFKTDTDIINFVKEIGVEDSLNWYPSLMSIYYNNHLHKFGTPISLLLFRPLNIINRIRVGMVMLYLQKYNNWRSFLDISAYDWIKKWSGEQATKVIWEPLLRGKFGENYNRISMAWLWARLHIRANSQEKGGEKLGYFDGGFDVIVKKTKELLISNGVNIKLNTEIKNIRESDLNKIILEIDNEIQEFDKVLFTGPSHIFAKLIKENKSITSEYLEKLNCIEYIGAVCMIFSSDQNISDYYWHNINDNSFPFLVFINHTKMVGVEKYNNKNIYYIGAYVPNNHKYFDDSNEEIQNLWFEYLGKIFPEFDKSLVNNINIFKFTNAQHLVTSNYEQKIPEYQTPIKNIYLSNFSQIFPEDRGTNYAVREGKKIANLIKSDN